MKNLITLVTLIICISANAQDSLNIELDVIEKGYYEVWVNGKKVSQHSKALKATARASQEKLKNNNAFVVVKQPNIEVEAVIDLPEIPEIPIDTIPEVIIPPTNKLLAFPTAYGAGAFTTGGRGGIVVHVTNLNADGKGSFKEALEMTVPRFIVFDVSGIITIDKLLYIDSKNSNFTIAGHTAPQGGITIAGGRVYFSGVTNYIIRHIRFKGGFEADWIPNTNDNKGSASFSSVGDQKDVIVDHCSFGFGETVVAWTKQGTKEGEVNNVTIQNCLFSESNKGVIIGKNVDDTPYYYSGNMTFYNNVFYNVRYRTPNLTGNHKDGNSFDIINNLAWGNQGRMVRSSGDTNINLINNATYHSPNFLVTDKNLNLHSEGWNAKIYPSGNYISAPSVSGDLSYSIAQMNKDNKLSYKYFVGSKYGVQLPDSFFVSEPFTIKGELMAIVNANDLRLTLPNNVGCNARLNADGSVSPNIDTHDAEYLNNILNDIMVTPLETYQLDPIPSVARPSDFYISNPHIPEVWFKANVPDGEDHNYIMSNGKTAFENYVESIDK